MKYTCHEVILHMLTGYIDCARGLVTMASSFDFQLLDGGQTMMLTFCMLVASNGKFILKWSKPQPKIVVMYFSCI